MVLRDGERPETSPLMAPAHPPAALSRWGPAEGTGPFPLRRFVRRLEASPGDKPHVWGQCFASLPPSEAALIKSISCEP